MPHPNDSKAKTPGHDFPLRKLCLIDRSAPWARLFSNLHAFLTTSRLQNEAGRPAFFYPGGFGAGAIDNLKELFKTGPRGPVHSCLLADGSPGFGGFWQNLDAVFSPTKKLSPAEAALAVPEIWSKNPRFVRLQAVSLAIHIAVIALVMAPLLPRFRTTSRSKPTKTEAVVGISNFHLTAPAAKRMSGGGSSHDQALSTRGQAPKFLTMQLTAPASHPVRNPQVSMPPTMLGEETIVLPNVNLANWGNPLSGLIGNSLGDAGGNGIGNGPGNGLGNGSDYGTGEVGHPAGYGGYGRPECLYCPNAQYSDEAVKAKYQGVVFVNALITPDGHATDVRVIKSLGLGLDENAVAAVRTWRFKPARGPDGKPAAVEQTIEVEFHLI